MSGIHRNLATGARGLALAALFSAASTGAIADTANVEAEAKQILDKSMTYLSGLQQFGLIAESSIEAVLESGQKIQFDSANAMAVKRPNRFYATRLGDLVAQEFFYDGKTLTLHDADAGFYAMVDAPDTLEQTLDFMRDELDILAPAADFLYADAYAILMEGVTSGFVVGPSVVDGVVTDHLAFSKPGTDFQVWVARGEMPLPLKLVITSRDVLSAPQFTVLLREWDVVQELPDGKFDFVAPEDAEAIDFLISEPEQN